MGNFKMDDYVPVNERIEEFYRAYPEGSIQSEIVELTDARVTVKAYAYRKPDDPRPGMGHSSLGIPGATTFTRGSEIENAETSAWGRAIAALGFEVKRGISSAEEVRNKPTQPERPPARPAGPNPRERMLAAAQAAHIGHDQLERYAEQVGVQKGAKATPEQIDKIIALIEQAGDGSAPAEPQESTPSGDAGSATGPTPPAATDSPEADVAPPASVSGDFLADVVAVTGGTIIPPEPGTPEYGALAPHEKAQARAFHAKPRGARETPEAEVLA